MIPLWLSPLTRLVGLWLLVQSVPPCISALVLIGDAIVSAGASLGQLPLMWWTASLGYPLVQLAAGLWFFFGTRHVISILMRGRFAAHCCQHCGYDPGPNRPERCPECGRAFPVIQSEPPASPPSSSAST